MLRPHQSLGEPDLVIGGLTIWVLSQERPQRDDYWDGNWLLVHARAEAPGARIDVQGPWLRTTEIARFHRELAAINRDLEGAAELACMEPALNVKITCVPLGHIEVVVDISPDHLSQTHQFIFSLDQSYLPPMISDCARLVHKFPLKGDPAM